MAFQGGCTILHSHQPDYIFSVAPHLPAFDVTVFWILVILMSMSWKQSHFKKNFQFPNDV